MARKSLRQGFDEWLEKELQKKWDHYAYGGLEKEYRKGVELSADDIGRANEEIAGIRNDLINSSKARAEYQKKYLKDLIKERQVLSIGGNKNSYTFGGLADYEWYPESGTFDFPLSIQSSDINANGQLIDFDLSEWFGHFENETEAFHYNLDNFINESNIFIDDEISTDEWKERRKKSQQKLRNKEASYHSVNDLDNTSKFVNHSPITKEKSFETWSERHKRSGLSLQGSGVEGSFGRVDVNVVDENRFRLKGSRNWDNRWLVESVAEATDDEIKDYLARLQKEGFSKKDLVQIKEVLEGERFGAQANIVNEFVKKGTTPNGNALEIMEVDGVEYAINGAGNMSGNSIHFQGMNTQTGEFVDLGQMVFGSGEVITEEEYRKAYETLKKSRTGKTKTVEEITAQIENYYKNQSQNQNTNQSNSSNQTESRRSIEDLDDETLANLTDDEIEDWAGSADDYKKATQLRQEAQERIKKNKPEPETPNTSTTTPEAPLDVDENIETHVDNADTKVNNNTNLPDMDVESPEVNLEGSKTRRTGRRKVKKNLTPKTGKGRGSRTAKNYTKGRSGSGKTMRVKGSLTKGRNITKGIAHTVASTVLNTAIESIDEAVEEGAQKVTSETIQNFTSNLNSGNNVFNQQTAQNILNNAVNNYTQNRTIGNNTANFNSLNSYQINNNFKHNGYNYTQPNQTGYTMTPITGVGPNGNLVKGTPQFVPPNLADDADDLAKSFKDVIGKDLIGTGMNVLGGIGAYKDARRKGHGVVSSVARAGIDFALGELLGPIGYFAIQGTVALGKGVIKGTEMLYKENRRMNSAANMQVFGGAEFQDTQQLATMRQSGMEMAKMAQYNLQQTLMGNEATHLHR